VPQEVQFLAVPKQVLHGEVQGEQVLRELETNSLLKQEALHSLFTRYFIVDNP